MKLFELQDRPEQEKNFDRNTMPQIRKGNLQNSPFKFRKGKISLNKLKPVQSQRVKGYHDKAKSGFADGSIRPIVIDKNNYIVNGHHRYDVACGLELKKVRVIKVDATIEELIEYFSETAEKEPTYEEKMKSKVDSLMETIEASQDISALMKGIEADLKQREKDLKRLPKKSVYEAPIIRPAGSYDPDANDAYNNATNRKPPKYDYDPEMDYRPGKSLGKIPNIQSETEVVQMPNGDLYLFYANSMSVSSRETPRQKSIWQKFIKTMLHNPKANQTGPNKEKNVLGFLKLKPFEDGYRVAGVGMDPEIRGQGKAIKFYLAFSAWKGVPIYSDFSQTPSAKTMWSSITARYPKRVVAYDQKSKKDIPLAKAGDMYQDQPDGFDDMSQFKAAKVLGGTKLFKLLPEGTRCWKGYKKKGTKKMFGKTVPNCVKNEGEVIPINKTEPKRVSYPPYFSPQEAQRAYDEWKDQAQVDQDEGVVIKATDGKQYIITTSYNNQAYDDGEVVLQGLTDPNYIELVNKKPYGHPDAAELLYYHSKDGTYVQIDEGPKDFADMKLDSKGKQDSIDYFYREHAPKFGMPVKAGRLGSYDIVTFSKGNLSLMFLVDAKDQPVFYIAFDKYKDGVAVGNVRSNGTVKSTDVYTYLVKKYGKLYSDGHQTPSGRKIWDNLTQYTNLTVTDVGDRLMATENFKDGKKPGRKGLAKRSGVNTKASVSSLRKTAKNSTGEKQRMAHWLANMKAGKKKK